MTETIAAGQLRAFIERIERLEEEKRTIADDIKEVKAEAKGCGFDVGAINAILKLRKMDQAERQEKEAILDLYMSALGMLPLEEYAARAPDREARDPAASAKLVEQVAQGMQTETGRKALVAALDVMIEREEQNSPETASESLSETGSSQPQGKEFAGGDSVERHAPYSHSLPYSSQAADTPADTKTPGSLSAGNLLSQIDAPADHAQTVPGRRTGDESRPTNPEARS